MRKVTIMLLGTLLLQNSTVMASAKAKPEFPQEQPSPVPSLTPTLKTKTASKPAITAEQVIEAADEAIKKKDEAIAQTNSALSDSEKALKDSQTQVISKDKQLGSLSKNGFVMLGAGTAGGALIAANVVAPGIGVLVVGLVFIIFKL